MGTLLVLGASASPAAADGFLPHAGCYPWDASLLALHAVTDALIGLSYVAISATLAFLVHRTRAQLGIDRGRQRPRELGPDPLDLGALLSRERAEAHGRHDGERHGTGGSEQEQPSAERGTRHELGVLGSLAGPQ
jgi:hypothetical protein